MKKLILALLVGAALAVPAAASAHGRGHHDARRDGRRSAAIRLTAVEHGAKLGWLAGPAHENKRNDADRIASTALFAKLSGTGTSFGTGSATSTGTIAGRPLGAGTYSATVTTDWSQVADDGHGGSCAPATATLGLVDGASSADTLADAVTGKTCAVASNDRDVAYVFFGTSTVSSAAGTLAGVSGSGRVLLVEKTDGTVEGFAFAGFKGVREHSFVSYATHDANGCDGDR
jgi:hypothetical protein